MPTVVKRPRLRKRRPRVIASLTEPPLESSTTVAPPICLPRANSSKSFGVSVVMIPTALTQPRQLGSQATQENFIGSLRSSSEPPARADEPKVATAPASTTPQAAVPTNNQPRRLSDLRSFKLVPSPSPKRLSLSRFRQAPVFPESHTDVTKMVSGRIQIVHRYLLHCSLKAGKIWRVNSSLQFPALEPNIRAHRMAAERT